MFPNRYLHKTLAQGVHEYLCSRLYTLPEADVERYLSQLTQLVVSRPDPCLERSLVDLCAQSLRIAVKTYWLLLAISQDNPKNTHVAALRDHCEHAGLEGHWEMPFKETRLPSPLVVAGTNGGIFGRGNNNYNYDNNYDDDNSGGGILNKYTQSHGKQGTSTPERGPGQGPSPFLTTPKAGGLPPPPTTTTTQNLNAASASLGRQSRDGDGGGGMAPMASSPIGMNGSGLPEIRTTMVTATPTKAMAMAALTTSLGNINRHNSNYNHTNSSSRGASPDIYSDNINRISRWRSGTLSPDIPSRPLSPDGLGDGIHSSVFMDTGVEGLLYDAEPSPMQRQQDTPSVSGGGRGGGGEYSNTTTTGGGGGGRQRGGEESYSSYTTGSLSNSMNLDSTPGSSTATSGLGRGAAAFGAVSSSSLQLAPVNGHAQNKTTTTTTAVGNAGNGTEKNNSKGTTTMRGSNSADASTATTSTSTTFSSSDPSPPNSPRRRETTFGATLDFVEALCTASSNLTVFQPEDRQWALHKALRSINAEMDRASAAGVAIWWPMGRSLRQRVVRLSYKESRLLNSREKAPFTLYVEVLNEAAAEAEAEAVAAAQHSRMIAELQLQKLPPLPPDVEKEDPAGAAAVAEGIPWVAHHHRRSSSVDTSSSLLVAAAAMAAVQGSSAAATTTAAAAAAAAVGGGGPRLSYNHHQQQQLAHPTPTEAYTPLALAGETISMQGGERDLQSSLLPVATTATVSAPIPPSLVSQRSNASTLATDLSLADFASEASHSPPRRYRPPSGGNADELLSFHPAPTAQQQQQQHPLPPLPRLSVQGGGHWIGGTNVRILSNHPSLGPSQDLWSEDLSATLASLRGEASQVSVRLQVIEDSMSESGSVSGLSRTNSGMGAVAGGGGGGGSTVPPPPSVAVSVSDLASSSSTSGSEGILAASTSTTAPAVAAAATRRSVVYPEQKAMKGASTEHSDGVEEVEEVVACAKNGWLCKLGLCKTCNAVAKQQQSVPAVGGEDRQKKKMDDEQEEQQPRGEERGSPAAPQKEESEKTSPIVQPQQQPRVKVILTVHSGLNLSIKRTSSRHQRMPSHEALIHVANEHQLPVPPPINVLNNSSATALPLPPLPPPVVPPPPPPPPPPAPPSIQPKSVHGEKWASIKQRIRASSPHGNRPGWDLRSVIVKSGDDCRQELLAMQLISTMHEVFAEAQLPIYLHPYEVLVTSNRTALIEMVHNAPSIHTIKATRPPGTSLRDHFMAEFGGPSTPGFKRAQRNFVESMAGYSLVCYMLQIKDRHNGNILLDDAGHVIHIDFGFMLSNSPGGVNFESAPFKLTRELLEVMDSDSEGRPSELFDYFKVLVIQGFLALRRHADRLTLLVEMMSVSGCPCFKNKVSAVQGLKRRLALGMPEHAVVELAMGLISDSLDAWRTRQYDYYQRVLNGIL